MRIPLFGILFLMLPILEIATIVLIGNAIGLLGTLGLLIGTSVLGILIFRWNAVSVVKQVQRTASGPSQAPSQNQLVATSMRSIGAILLILPGFICKTVGLLFLLPPLQKLLWSKIVSRMKVYRTRSAGGFEYSSQPHDPSNNQHNAEPTVVDLDNEDFERHPNQNSPWYDDKNGNDQKRID